ncbi:type III secretion system chaperone [Comamonas endophytica]|uniref:Type III secretion system chaperone n=1 Tax=Comamonas endophytica TaxID=2949090 RepID=A0ABY6GEH9_9BURK|nr:MULTISPECIES: type III secretion system chaperone [unclassified Acidovorax]MCD2513147.1 type III secretion system chaperone [Acidovorax sp. D4N7]UYG53502.1 type III secretion system chaperone [Acidovorax sp. 5MLIR]
MNNIPEQVQALVRALGQRMGLRQFQLDAEGSCALELDRRIVVNLQYRETENELWLYSDLGPVPQRSLAFYEKLLRANLFWQQTSGATLSLSGDQLPRAVLARPLPWTLLEDTSFGAAVEAFVHTTEEWQKQLEQAALTNADVGTAAEGSAFTAGSLELLLQARA